MGGSLSSLEMELAEHCTFQPRTNVPPHLYEWQTPCDETLYDETPSDETLYDETPCDETLHDETPCDETLYDETPHDDDLSEASLCETPLTADKLSSSAAYQVKVSSVSM